ncbi:MAG: glycine--tRNA ligase [Patescibacteria group bacterium]
MPSLDQIVSLCKQRGFVFPGSEIYGGLANTWDYGPIGVELKNNVKKFWWDFWVRNRDDIVGVDASILMNPKVWEASGHVSNFADPLVDCKACKKRFRGDKLLEEKLGVEGIAGIALVDVTPKLLKEKIACPDCGKCDWAEAKQFNLMFKTQQGVTEDSEREIYMRPETAQGIFVNFKNVLNSTRKKLPFGIAQIGKAFRNEITPGNFTFRTREFEQMEVEYFCAEKDWEKIYPKLEKASWDFFEKLGIDPKNLRWRKHGDAELSHYSKLTKDIEYKFPWGWGELQGLAYRTDFDLKQHQKFSGESLEYLDSESGEKFTPHCIEPSFGCDRTVLTVLLDAYCEDDVNGEKRTVMKFAPEIAPIKVAVLPLSRKEKLTKKAREIFDILRTEFRAEFDETQSIGKRYRRQDEIGTPLCVTVDFGTIGEDEKQSKKGCVTLRDRDSLKQEEVEIKKLPDLIRAKLKI